MLIQVDQQMSNEIDKIYQIRDVEPQDIQLILATFLRGLYYGHPHLKLIPKQVFMNHYKNVARQLLFAPSTYTRVACLKEDPTIILGYAMTNGAQDTLHWVYVKSAWRRQGIAKALVPPTVTAVTHLSSTGLILLEKTDIVFNPFLLEGV